jgi:hypothetical protein
MLNIAKRRFIEQIRTGFAKSKKKYVEVLEKNLENS